MAVIEFRTLGTLDLRRGDGTELHSLLAQPKRVALLAYLCVAKPRGFHRRDTLLGLFWPDADQAHARTSLRNALYVLRHALGESALHSRGDEEIGVDFGVIWCDAIAFEERVTSDQAEAALEVYRGDLLTGFFLEDVPVFERWLESERMKLRASAARAAGVAAKRLEAAGSVAEAVSFARRAVDLASTDEPALRNLIQLLARAGDRAGGLHAYENFARSLAAEFGAQPSTETQAVANRLRSEQAIPPELGAPETIRVVESSMAPGKRPSLSNIGRVLAPAAAALLLAFAAWKVRPSRPSYDARATLVDRMVVTNSGSVSHSAISPNGKTLAYVTTECRTEGCAYALELKEVEGSASRVIMDGIDGLAPHGLDWSPDGSKILVTGRIRNQQGTFLTSPLGGEPRRLGPGRYAFYAGGDSLIVPGSATARVFWVLISGLDGVPRDSISITGKPVDSSGRGIGRLIPIPQSKSMFVAFRRGSHFQWASIDRNGQILDTLAVRPVVPSRASADALWLSTQSSQVNRRAIVRIPFDPKTGRFALREDTIVTGTTPTFDVTPDGSALVFDEGVSEFSGWALEMSDVLRGKFPENKRLLTASSNLLFELSPDGKRILVGRVAGPSADQGRNWDILPFDGGPMTPLAATPSTQSASPWADSATIPVITTGAKGSSLALLDINTGARRAVYLTRDTLIREATALAGGGWIWIPAVAEEFRLYEPSSGTVRKLRLPPRHGAQEALAPSADGKKLLLVSGIRDTVRVSIMSLPDGGTRPVKTVAGGAAFAVWLRDESIMLAVWRRPDSGLTLYRLRESGETLWTATIPHPVWSISVSADMTRAALTVREYHGDASMGRIVRH